MQNLDVKDTIKKINETKSEIKKELEVSISNGRNDNTDMKKKSIIVQQTKKMR